MSDVRPFGGRAPVERVIEENEQNRPRIAEVPFLKGGGSRFDVENRRVVPVETQEHELLGFARLRREGDCLAATLYLDPATPERLSIEVGITLYCWVDWQAGEGWPATVNSLWVSRVAPTGDPSVGRIEPRGW